jgi:hypothetical protein
LQALWKDLEAISGADVHRGIWGLVARSDTAVPYLETVLRPVPKIEDKMIFQWTKDLDHDDFQVREKATQELQKLGELIEPVLKKLVIDSKSAEVKVRAEVLLERSAKKLQSPERMQTVRALESLEYMGTPQALTFLRELAHGNPAAQVTREATASLKRLAKRKGMER